MDFLVVMIFYVAAIIGLCAFAINEALVYLDHIWKVTGYWADRDKNRNQVAGPLAMCIKCKKSVHFKWEDWRALPENKKIELAPWKKEEL